MRQRKVAARSAVQQDVTECCRDFVAELLSDFRAARNIAGSIGDRQGSGYIEYLQRLKGIKRETINHNETFKGDRDRQTDRQKERKKPSLLAKRPVRTAQ
jgi:hypothetical protein